MTTESDRERAEYIATHGLYLNESSADRLTETLVSSFAAIRSDTWKQAMKAAVEKVWLLRRSAPNPSSERMLDYGHFTMRQLDQLIEAIENMEQEAVALAR